MMKNSDGIRHFIHQQILPRLKHARNYFTVSPWNIQAAKGPMNN